MRRIDKKDGTWFIVRWLYNFCGNKLFCHSTFAILNNSTNIFFASGNFLL